MKRTSAIGEPRCCVSGGGVFLDGEWLRVGSVVTILRDGYRGRQGVFKGKRPNNKLLVNLEGGAVKLHLTAAEIRRTQKPTGDVRT